MATVAVTNTIAADAGSSFPKRLNLRGGAIGPRSRVSRKPVFEDTMAERKYMKERLAGAFRIFSRMGYDEGIAGHITLRDPVKKDAFWVNPFGVSFELMTVSDLLLIDHDGNILEGGKPGNGQIYNAAGFAIHGAIHRARQDIHAAAHSHSPYGRAFSALGRNIDIASLDGAAYGETVRLYNDFGGVVLDDEEGKNICKALGPHGKGVILRNHGILTASSNLDAAIAYFVRLEQLCESQLMADVNGESNLVTEDEAAAVFKTLGNEDEAWFQAQEMYEWLDSTVGDAYKQ